MPPCSALGPKTLSSESVLRVVVPARLGSERLPNKPLASLGGIPMVQRVAAVAQRALPGIEVIVAADSPEILDALSGTGVSCVLTSSAHRSGTDRIAEVAALLDWADHDLVINLQGDEPLIPLDLVASFARFCRTTRPLSMATVAVPVQAYEDLMDENVVKLVCDSFGRALYFSRAALPATRGGFSETAELGMFRRHVGIYGYMVAALRAISAEPECAMEKLERLEQLRALYLGLAIDVMDWPVSPPQGVDTLEDLERVRAILEAGI